MAPRKPVAAKMPPAVKRGSVVKRPARGYHKFKDGMLNVRPKGHEKALVSNNQTSPLLRLPAEIRNNIWKYALGGMEFRLICVTTRKSSFQPKPSGMKNIMALLRVCRQIYSETAPLSFAVNSFSASCCATIPNSSFKPFQKYQLNQIKEIQIEMRIFAFIEGRYSHLTRIFYNLKFDLLSELRYIRICLFPHPHTGWEEKSFAECEKIVRSIVHCEIQLSSYNLVFEKMEVPVDEFINNWYALS